MRLDAFIVGLALFSLVMVVGAAYVVDVSNNYGADYSDQFGSTYNLSEELFDLTKDQKENTIDTPIGDVVDFLDRSLRAVTTMLRLLTAPIGMIFGSDAGPGMFDDFTQKTGISPIFARFGQIMLTVLIVFGIAYLYFRIRSW